MLVAAAMPYVADAVSGHYLLRFGLHAQQSYLLCKHREYGACFDSNCTQLDNVLVSACERKSGMAY